MSITPSHIETSEAQLVSTPYGGANPLRLGPQRALDPVSGLVAGATGTSLCAAAEGDGGTRWDSGRIAT